MGLTDLLSDFYTAMTFTEAHAEAPADDNDEKADGVPEEGGDEKSDEGNEEETEDGGDDKGGEDEKEADDDDEEEEEEEEEEPEDVKPKLEEGICCPPSYVRVMDCDSTSLPSLGLLKHARPPILPHRSHAQLHTLSGRR